eukprot:gene23399-biopygen16357
MGAPPRWFCWGHAVHGVHPAGPAGGEPPPPRLFWRSGPGGQPGRAGPGCPHGVPRVPESPTPGLQGTYPRATLWSCEPSRADVDSQRARAGLLVANVWRCGGAGLDAPATNSVLEGRILLFSKSLKVPKMKL